MQMRLTAVLIIADKQNKPTQGAINQPLGSLYLHSLSTTLCILWIYSENTDKKTSPITHLINMKIMLFLDNPVDYVDKEEIGLITLHFRCG